MIKISKKNSLFKLEMLILLSLKNGDYYGYEISQLIKEKTNGIFEIKEGVMYPLLHSLLDSGHITSFEKIVNRRIRVYYHIEEKGRVYLSQLFEDFNNKVAILQRLNDEER